MVLLVTGNRSQRVHQGSARSIELRSSCAPASEDFSRESESEDLMGTLTHEGSVHIREEVHTSLGPASNGRYPVPPALFAPTRSAVR